MGVALQHPLPAEMETALPRARGLGRIHPHVALLDRTGHVLWLSEALQRLCPASPVEGRPWLSALARAQDAERLRHAVTLGRPVLDEPVQLRGESGAGIPATVSTARVGRECNATVAIFRPDEPRESELRATLRGLAAVLDSAPYGVAVVDCSRFFLYVNPRFEEMSGWRAEELIDRPAAVLLRGQGELERAAEMLREQPSPGGAEIRLRRRDGSALELSVSASPLALEDGTTVGNVAYVQDITERRRFARDLARKNEELEHYVRAVSHDLRSPLVSVLGFSRLLREDFGEVLGEKGRHFVRRIEEAGRSMETLIHDLLELSRIGVGEEPAGFVDTREILMQIRAEQKPRLDELGVTIRLPEDPPRIRCERTRLYQVFANLIGNALDHMGKVPDPEVRVEVVADAQATRISVRDNGVGIAPEDHERIFEIFRSLSRDRGPGARRRSGMGLAIVKKIAESLGGRVRVESERGCGACFHVELPPGRGAA